MKHTQSSSDTNAPWALADLATRIELYLDDAPIYGGHSDKAGGNCWELLREAMEELRTASSPTPQIARDVKETGHIIDDYHHGYRDGWENAHQPAICGHARGNWKDPMFGTPAYKGDEQCEVCAILSALSPQAQAGDVAQAALNEPVCWIVLAKETDNVRIWWRRKEMAEEWAKTHNAPLIPLYAHPRCADAVLLIAGSSVSSMPGNAAQASWMPIDTAPKNRNILLDYDGNVVIGGFDRHQQNWTDGDNYIPTKEIRGWMELPATSSLPSTSQNTLPPQACADCENTGWCHANDKCYLKGVALSSTERHTPSDMRLKEDIAPVGTLFDGTPVYGYRYKGAPAYHIGLLAQDVEKTNPTAVIEINGYKAVDYRAATEASRRIGAMTATEARTS